MVFYEKIRKTLHYVENQERSVPWSEVVLAMDKEKSPRKNGNTLEIENDKCYIVYKVQDNIAYVINAKRK